MTLANSVTAKLSVAFVALATAFVLAAPAQAQMSEDEMQGEIDRLTTLIEQLTSSLGGGDVVVTGGNTSSVCPYMWSRPLNMGATGPDVMKLQQFLNSNELTRVAATGVGSVGMETEYYGPMTGAAVAKFQELNRAAILDPIGLVNSTTYFGPATMAEANAQCASAPVVVDDVVDDVVEDDDDANDDANDDDDMAELGDGEGSIESLDRVSADESNLEEGVTYGLFAFTAEIEGDVEVNRVDVYLDSTDAGSESSNADDYFQGAELWVDGDKVADLDVEDFDEDEYGNVGSVVGDDDEYRLRFSGLGLVFADGDEPEFQVALEANSNIDSGDLTETWGFDNPDLRFVDGEGFSDSYSDSSVDDTFGLDEEEAAELDISESSNSPEGTTIEVDDDNDSDEEEVFVVNIEEKNGVDVEVREVTMTASTTDGDVTSTIDEVVLYVDGEEVGSDTPSAAGALTFENVDFTVAGDGDVDLTAMVVFKGWDGNYTQGDEVFLTFNAVTDARDDNGNDEDEITGANPSDFDSETFTLREEGVILTADSDDHEATTGDTNGDTAGGEVGEFTIEFSVEAFADDMYLPKGATSTTGAVTQKGVVYVIEDEDGTTVATGTSVAVVSATADDDTGYFEVLDGEGNAETFTLEITYTPTSDGYYRARVYGVNYNVGSAGAADAMEVPASEADFRTDFEYIDV